MTFKQFYSDHYLPRHPAGPCRWLHAIGLPAGAAYGITVAWLGHWWLLIFLPVPTYLFGWLGHLTVPNRPTFFEHPVWSFRGYWRLMAAIARGRAAVAAS